MPETHQNYRWKMPVLGILHGWWRGMCRGMDMQARWAKWLGLPFAPIDFDTPGLILVQIDGLSHARLQTALERGRMPFLARLLSREQYLLREMYSGVPSTTPAVQGELFYGVQQAVPAFAFRETPSGETRRMNEAEMAQQVETTISGKGSGLLQGGSAATNIFTGGASEARFCASVLGWNTLQQHASRTRLAMFMLANSMSVCRAIGSGLLEAIAATGTALAGIAQGNPTFPELRMIPSRSIVGVMLRDLATSGACLDAARGLPVIQLNYLAYDEHAHLRGTASNHAIKSLRGVDRSIKKLWKAAARSRRRDYQLWVYSDHGQEDVVNYQDETGQELEEAIRRVVDGTRPSAEAVSINKVSSGSGSSGSAPKGIAGERARWLRAHRPRSTPPAVVAPNISTVNVTAIGPIGFVYLSQHYSAEALLELAARLVAEAAIPLVIVKDAAGAVWAFNREGKFLLPANASSVLGPGHPYAELAAEDLASLAAHIHAGQLIISGYRTEGSLLTFVAEKGAHGGPGPLETGAFVAAPADAPLPGQTERLRPADLRHAIQSARAAPSEKRRPMITEVKTHALTVVTYNAHTCIGMDGRLSPRRIARVLQQCNADVIALQELDVLHRRTESMDQAREIARLLGMECHFHPAMSWGEEHYGDALLSRYPLRLVRAATLPSASPGHREPRGAIWASIQLNGEEVQIINTHLGLGSRERQLQVAALLGQDWLGDPRCGKRTIVCGDLNSPPFSRAYKQMAQRLRDVQVQAAGTKAQNTWFGAWPLLRLDHIFVSPDIQVANARIIGSRLARCASDHLPLVAELRFTSG